MLRGTSKALAFLWKDSSNSQPSFAKGHVDDFCGICRLGLVLSVRGIEDGKWARQSYLSCKSLELRMGQTAGICAQQ